MLKAIKQFPRVKLASLPTPLEEMASLTRLLQGPRIWIKRDDCTALAFGGSKTRLLEFSMADALNKGADVVITGGSLGSNLARLTAAAASKLGLKSVIILSGKKPREFEGNLLLARILGADVRFAGRQALGSVFEKTMVELGNEGHVPYLLYGSSPIGMVGYVNGALELQTQARAIGFNIDYVVTASSSGGIQAGLTFGCMLQNSRSQVIGVSAYAGIASSLKSEILSKAKRLNEIFGSDVNISAENFPIVDFYSGDLCQPAHCRERVMTAISVVAEREGILLDPIYTGKAMAVLFEMVKRKRFSKQDNVVFIHTGGTPALFADVPGYPFVLPPGLFCLFNELRHKYGFARKIAARFLRVSNHTSQVSEAIVSSKSVDEESELRLLS